MKDKDAELLAQAMTECYASTRGCKRLPVRMVAEIPKDRTDGTDAEIVLMCVDHAATYIPRGQVVHDETLLSDENLKMFGEMGL